MRKIKEFDSNARYEEVRIIWRKLRKIESFCFINIYIAKEVCR
jgi:hypothetical protein